jgi:hypothetical protein
MNYTELVESIGNFHHKEDFKRDPCGEIDKLNRIVRDVLEQDDWEMKALLDWAVKYNIWTGNLAELKTKKIVQKHCL